MHTHGRKNPCVQLASPRASSAGTGSCEGGIFINLLMLLTLCPSNDSSLEALWLEYLIGQGGMWRQSSTVLQMSAAVRAGAVTPGGDRRCGPVSAPGPPSTAGSAPELWLPHPGSLAFPGAYQPPFHLEILFLNPTDLSKQLFQPLPFLSLLFPTMLSCNVKLEPNFAKSAQKWHF